MKNNCFDVDVRLSNFNINVVDLQQIFDVNEVDDVNDVDNHSRKIFSIIVYVNIIEMSFFVVSFKISIIIFDVDVFKNIDIECEYRE